MVEVPRYCAPLMQDWMVSGSEGIGPQEGVESAGRVVYLLKLGNLSTHLRQLATQIR